MPICQGYIHNYKCNCGASFEDAIHYFLECSLEALLFGNDDDSYDVYSKMFGKLRTIVNQSKRF